MGSPAGNAGKVVPGQGQSLGSTKDEGLQKSGLARLLTCMPVPTRGSAVNAAVGRLRPSAVSISAHISGRGERTVNLQHCEPAPSSPPPSANLTAALVRWLGLHKAPSWLEQA